MDTATGTKTDDPVRRFPCKPTANVYTGCIGFQACANLGTDKCWDGRTLTPVAGLGPALMEEPTPFHQLPYWHARTSRTKCATCVHAVEYPDAQRRRLEDGGFKDLRLYTCSQGLWVALCSLYALNNHRMPLRPEVGDDCEHYQQADELRPELVAQREADKRRSRTRREALKESRQKKSGQPWGEVL